MKFETLIYKQDRAVATITLNRPQALNAMTQQMHKEIFKALDAIREDASVRVLILTGAGRGFCAGDDMKESDPRDGALPPEDEVEIVWHNIVRKMRALPKPVIAAVNGIACGAGSGLVLGSDIRFASNRARFADIFIRRGIAGGSYLLPQTVGTAKGLELIFTGDIIEADEACRIGIFNRVVAHELLEQVTMEFAKRLASGPAESLALSKAAVYKSAHMDLEEGFRVEEEAKLKSLKSQDVREGIMSFVDKRKAAFQGR